MAVNRTVATLNVKVTVDNKQVTAQLKTTQKQFSSFFTKVKTLAAGFVVGDIIANSLRIATMAIGSSFRRVVELDQQFKAVQKTTNFTAKEIEALAKTFEGLASKLPVSRQELAEIAETAGRLGVEGSKNVAKFAEDISKISVALNLSADGAADTFARLSVALKEPTSKILNMASAVNELENNTATTSARTLEAARIFSATAAQMGVTTSQVFALSGALTATGLDASEAGTALKNAFIFASTKAEEFGKVIGLTGDQARDALSRDAVGTLKLYIKELGNAANGSEALAEAAKIFGTRSSKAIVALGNNMALLEKSLKLAEKGFKDGTSVEKEFALQAKGAASILKVFGNNVKILTDQIINAFLPSILEVVQALIVMFQDFQKGEGILGAIKQAISATIDIFSGFVDIVKSLAPALAAVGAVMLIVNAQFLIGQAAIIASGIALKVFMAINIAYTTVLKAVTVAMKLMNLVNPVGWIIIAVGFIATLIANMDGLKAGVLKLFSGFVKLLSLIPGVKELLKFFGVSTAEEEAQQVSDIQQAQAEKQLLIKEKLENQKVEVAKEGAEKQKKINITMEQQTLLSVLKIEKDKQNAKLGIFAEGIAKRLGLLKANLNAEKLQTIKTRQNIENKLLGIFKTNRERELRLVAVANSLTL